MYYVYIILNLINDKMYIGKTGDLSDRWSKHKSIGLGGKEKYGKRFQAIHAAINKYGSENFEFFPIEAHNDEKFTYDRETILIEEFGTRKSAIGYNEKPGGMGFMSGENHPMYGKPISEEHRQKLKIARNNHPSASGWKASPEAKAKMSEDRVGSKNVMFGKRHSEETKKKISDTRKASNQSKGENSHWALLTNNQAKEIRILYFEQNKKRSEIAKIYNVAWDIIHDIVMNRTYKS